MTAMLMVVLAAFPVFGKEVPDVNRQGSISLTLQDSQSGAYMENGAVTLYQVGEIRVDDGNYSWRLSGAFSGSGLSLENLSSGQLAQELNVDNLILYHTEDKNISRRKELYTEEGREYYKGNLLIPDDLETFEL